MISGLQSTWKTVQHPHQAYTPWIFCLDSDARTEVRGSGTGDRRALQDAAHTAGASDGQAFWSQRAQWAWCSWYLEVLGTLGGGAPASQSGVGSL